MTLLGISSRNNTFHRTQSEITFIKAEGCLEEALIQLSRDNDYTGDVYTVDELSCNVIVNGSGNERTVELAGVDGDYVHNFTVQIQVLPSFAILDFSY